MTMEDQSDSPTTRLLQTTCLRGTWQMAIDAALLRRRQPVLRLYRWSRPTLSLGFHQRELRPSWLSWASQGLGDLVRRPSGGGAVLHGTDLCYALVWPDPGCSRQQAYGAVCRWLQQAFAQLGEPLQFGEQPASADPDCFARSTSADLVNRHGLKRIGSAQRWQQGCLLQHGSIQLQPDRQSWPVLLDGQAPELALLPLGTQELEQHLVEQARLWLDLPAQAAPLSAELLSEAGEQLETYRLAPGDSSDTSPLASMLRTT